MRNLPTWAIWSIAVACVLSPVLAFLGAIAVEILIGVLKDAGMLQLLLLVAIGAIGWPLLRKLAGAAARKRSGRDPNRRAKLLPE
jgi:hypothetical protein